jgi:hypothetical protein
MFHDLNEKLVLEEGTCMRCGLPSSYHSRKLGIHRIKCIRKNPYKLRDSVDAKIGMQVWICHPYEDVHGKYDKNAKLKTGLIRFVNKGGSLKIWKFPQDRDQSRIFDICWEPYFPASFCFSSEENAEKFRRKNV